MYGVLYFVYVYLIPRRIPMYCTYLGVCTYPRSIPSWSVSVAPTYYVSVYTVYPVLCCAVLYCTVLYICIPRSRIDLK